MEKPRKNSKEGLPPTFDEGFKIAVAREYLNGKYSQAQIARKYGLPSDDTVRYFIGWYKKWLKKHDLPLDAEVPSDGAEASRLAFLEEALNKANIKITALEMTLQKAEETFDIDITKKSGTK